MADTGCLHVLKKAVPFFPDQAARLPALTNMLRAGLAACRWSAPSAATSAAGPPARVPEPSPLLPFRPAEKQVGCKRKQVGPCSYKVRPVYVFVCSGGSLISSAPAYGGWGARPSAPFRGQPPPPATRGARCYIPSPAYRDACSCTRCSRRCCRRAARG